MTELFPYFVAILTFTLGYVAIHYRHRNEALRADYRLRSQTQAEREDLEREIHELKIELSKAIVLVDTRLTKVEDDGEDRDKKLREDFQDNDQKLQLRIAAIETAWTTAQNRRL